MGHIIDLVPNHMGIAQSANPWWQDVLENGPSSRYADVFDIDWHPLKPELEHKVLLPVLGDSYGAVLERQEITLEYVARGVQRALLRHACCRLRRAPTSASSASTSDALLDGDRAGRDAGIEFLSILTAIRHLPGRDAQTPELRAERDREKEVIKRRLAALTTRVAAGAGAHRPRGRRAQRRRRAIRGASTPRRAAVRAAVPARVLARGRRGNQLPPLLRHQRARGAPDGGSGGLRARRTRSPSSCCAKAASTDSGSTTSTASTIPATTSNGCRRGRGRCGPICSPGDRRLLPRRRKDSRARRMAAVVAGRRDDRLRIPGPRERPVRRRRATSARSTRRSSASRACARRFASSHTAASSSILRMSMASELQRARPRPEPLLGAQSPLP